MRKREVIGHLRDLYGMDVSPVLISTASDAMLDEIATWHGRPPEAAYPLVFFNALRVKIRDEGLVCNKAVNVALGVRADGHSPSAALRGGRGKERFAALAETPGCSQTPPRSLGRVAHRLARQLQIPRNRFDRLAAQVFSPEAYNRLHNHHPDIANGKLNQPIYPSE
jgi:hypothetical protein